MNVLMYPLGPDDDFPDEFCAIRQGSGEHWFYVPEGESASELLLRMEVENAKLREHIASFKELSQDMVIYAGQNMKRHSAKRLRKPGVPL